MQRTALTLTALLGAALPAAARADDRTAPAGVLDRLDSVGEIATFVHGAAAKAPPAPAPTPRPPRFALPASRPRGAPRAVPVVAAARGDGRTVTVVEHWSVDDGKKYYDERYVVRERVGELRGGRPYMIVIDVLEAAMTPPPPPGPSEALPRGSYLRVEEPIMIGDAQAPFQLWRVTGDDLTAGLERREAQTLYDVGLVEDTIARLMTAVAQQPLRAGETVDLLPYVWTMNMVADRIHRAADRGPLARYVITSEGSRRATLDVDGQGRPVRVVLELAAHSTTEVAFAYD